MPYAEAERYVQQVLSDGPDEVSMKVPAYEVVVGMRVVVDGKVEGARSVGAGKAGGGFGRLPSVLCELFCWYFV